MPDAFRQLQAGLLKRPGGDREMVEILSLVLHHDEQAVLSAVELALDDGVPTKIHVLNILHRLIDGKAPPAPPIDAPQALRLDKEPRANVEIYDTLREMYGMAQAVGDLIEQGAPAFEAAVPILAQVLKAEMAEREVRSIAYQIKAARFPAYKDLAGFDFAASEINEALVRQLYRGDFMDSADNVVLI
ncbi:hypothetical protein KXX23_008747, partial [Aspergillus fumigatus]